MAQTTGKISAKDLVILLNGVDVSGSAGYVRIRPTREVGRASTFDGDNRLKVYGKQDWTIELRLIYTEIANEAFEEWWDAINGNSAVSFEARPKGTASGNWAFSGNVLFTDGDMPFDSDTADIVQVTANGEGDGTLTKSTQA